MRILVLQATAREQLACSRERLDDGLVGVALLALVGDDAPAGEPGRMVSERAVLVDRVGDRGIDAAGRKLARARGPHVEVLAAVAGRGMHEAGAGIVRHVVAGEQRDDEFVSTRVTFQRMRGRERREIIGRHRAQLLEPAHARLAEHFFGELVGNDQPVTDLGPVVGRSVGDPVETIGDPGRIADRAVARDGPGRRGPDDDRAAAIGLFQRGEAVAEREGDRKLHPHLVRDIVLVLDLGLGERGLLHHRPHHRLGAAIERAVGGEFHQLARDLRLRGEAHRGVGVVPVALDAEPLELAALHVQPVFREGAAFGAELVDRNHVLVLALGAVVLLDLPLDRQAMAVPAGHVVGVVAEHLLRARHHVLEDLVERGADMDVAVGVGRAIMQDELGPAVRGVAQALIQVEPLPARKELRLLLGQAGAHREVGLRQKQRRAVVAGIGHRGIASIEAWMGFGVAISRWLRRH